MSELPGNAAASADFEFAALVHAHNYRRALLQEFAPGLRGRVLEAGAGVGQFTELLRGCQGIEHLLALEPDPVFCRELRDRLPDQAILQGTIGDVQQNSDWDSIVSVNVLEHIQDDGAELRAYHQLLSPRGGALNLFVPARPEIYAPIDKDFGHHRRYARSELKQKLEQAGFEIERLRYFNLPGYGLWWLMFCVLKQRKFSVCNVRLFDRFIFPWVHWLESRLAPPIGMSLLAVARARHS